MTAIAASRAPGWLRAPQQQYGIDLGRSYLIGDRWRDIDAGTRRGMQDRLD